jgi:hypothetical protein
MLPSYTKTELYFDRRNLPVKLLVYGLNPSITGLAFIATTHGDEILNIHNIEDIPLLRERNEKPDIALIERKAEDAVNIVTQIKALWKIPVVLLVGEGIEEWQGLDKFMVDGYINDTFSESESLARLSATHRRFEVKIQS